MKAHKTKEIYYACHGCGGANRDIHTSDVIFLVGVSIGWIRKTCPSYTQGAPDDMFTEDPNDANTIIYNALVCSECDQPVARWNVYLDETAENKAAQIEKAPLNRAEIVRLWQCGSCNNQTWDSNEAEDCCL